METEIIQQPVIELDETLKEDLLNQLEEAGLIVIHCSHSGVGGGIRIWPSTFLIDRDSPARSKLLHVFGITMAPQWMYVEPGKTARFTLVFEPLPKTCTVFDFLEEIPLPGAFCVKGIARNKSDVYRIQIG
jgi:hypothetical protein